MVARQAHDLKVIGSSPISALCMSCKKCLFFVF